MEYRKYGNILGIRLRPEEKIVESLSKIFHEQKIEGGCIVSAVASLNEIILRNVKNFEQFPIADANRSFKKICGPLELLSLHGNISTTDKIIVVHLHASVSDGSSRMLGGHLIEATVLSTAEIFVAVTKRIERKLDAQTGALELSFV
ncbi:MAG: PPC domain-containing DNA-binding protein [Campylobacterota bacterium]|nr:PPC domain-containing DNA-binding protein [Campylobacterota bacterium]